jgi:lipid-A-disaccharide synthase
MKARTHPLHVGIVAGEPSGDVLGNGIITALREQVPDAVFEGIGGSRMSDNGCFSLYPLERLSVMGFTEVIGRLPALLSIRRELRSHFLGTPPDIFIGIDAPDFNLPLERALKQAGIRTMHYVSPAVWAWRRYRVGKIAQCTDCLLTLFPFEKEYYRKQPLTVEYVGHPLADQLADEVDIHEARSHLGLEKRRPIAALLPGSRVNEVRQLARPFIEAAAWCYERRPDLKFVVPLANDACRSTFERILNQSHKQLPIVMLNGQSLEAMAASDAVLLASGTASLECLLLKRPMVVAYKMSPVSYRIARSLVKTDHYSLPNLLAGRPVVTELIQDGVTAERLGRELMKLLENRQHADEMCAVFSGIHEQLRRDANRTVAKRILEMTGRNKHAAA